MVSDEKPKFDCTGGHGLGFPAPPPPIPEYGSDTVYTQLIQEWLDWKMSEVDEQDEDKTRCAKWMNKAKIKPRRRITPQEWKRQGQIILEEKNGLSVFKGKRKPNTY